MLYNILHNISYLLTRGKYLEYNISIPKYVFYVSYEPINLAKKTVTNSNFLL